MICIVSRTASADTYFIRFYFIYLLLCFYTVNLLACSDKFYNQFRWTVFRSIGRATREINRSILYLLKYKYTRWFESRNSHNKLSRISPQGHKLLRINFKNKSPNWLFQKISYMNFFGPTIMMIPKCAALSGCK